LNYSSMAGTQSIKLDNFGGAQAIDLAEMQGLDTKANPAYSIVVALEYGNNPLLSQKNTRSLQRQWNLVDTASFSTGRHQFRFGGDYRRLAPVVEQVSPNVSYYYFSPAATLANSPDLAFAASSSPAYPLYTNFSGFGQDEWKLTRRLTLSFGVRWEVNPAPGVTRGLKPYTVAGANDVATMTLAPEGTALWKTGWHNFAPRLGVAYLLRDASDFATVIRGGVGVFYDTGQQAGSWGYQGPGFSSFVEPAGPLSFPVPTLAAPPAPTNPPLPQYGFVYGYSSALQLPYTVQANLSLQQALGKSQTFTMSYVSALGRKLLEQKLLVVSPTVNPNFSRVGLFQNGLTSDYEALQMQFQRRISRGIQALASYTWSHCLDYGSNDTEFPYVRGNCDYDVRHNLSGALSYELPSLSRRKLARTALDHWSFDGRFTARTAFPVDLLGSTLVDPVTGVTRWSSLNLVPGQAVYVYGSQYPGGRAINPDAFSVPLSGQYGDSPRNFTRGFGAWQLDLAIRREFPIFERLKLQFRAEVFNLFNHPNFGTVDATLGDTTFGQATATLAQSLGTLSPLFQLGGPRSMQFALKLLF